MIDLVQPGAQPLGEPQREGKGEQELDDRDHQDDAERPQHDLDAEVDEHVAIGLERGRRDEAEAPSLQERDDHEGQDRQEDADAPQAA